MKLDPSSASSIALKTVKRSRFSLQSLATRVKRSERRRWPVPALIGLIALGFVLLYLLKQRQTHDDAWQKVRERRARRRRIASEEEINPDFQFDRPVEEPPKPSESAGP